MIMSDRVADNKPLYLKITDSVKEEIKEDLYKPGDLLPTEEELTRKYNASRTTVRNALAVLERDGYVRRRQGMGTVVKDIKSTQNLNYLSSLSECFEGNGKKVTTGMLTISLVKPPENIRKELEISGNEVVYRLQRTRIVDGIIAAYINNYIDSKITPGLDSRNELLKRNGLYNVLESEYGLDIDSCVETINAYISGPMETEILQLDNPIALFLSRRTTRLADGRLFEYVTSVIRGDMHQYTVFLKDRNRNR